MKKKPSVESTSEAIEARIELMERKLERLRTLYESFFMGIERAPPNVPRREMNRLILEMQQEQINNASLRFRFQSMMQRWVLYIAYWNRTMREIESGTYRRDLARAQRHLAERGTPLTEQEAVAMGIPTSRAKAFIERQNKMIARRTGPAPTTARPAASSTSASPEPQVPGVSQADLESLYRRYVETHSRVNDPRPALSLEKIRERLSAQIPKIMAERKCRKVKLDIAVEDGRVRLRAWPVE